MLEMEMEIWSTGVVGGRMESVLRAVVSTRSRCSQVGDSFVCDLKRTHALRSSELVHILLLLPLTTTSHQTHRHLMCCILLLKSKLIIKFLKAAGVDTPSILHLHLHLHRSSFAACSLTHSLFLSFVASPLPGPGMRQPHFAIGHAQEGAKCGQGAGVWSPWYRDLRHPCLCSDTAR